MDGGQSLGVGVQGAGLPVPGPGVWGPGRHVAQASHAGPFPWGGRGELVSQAGPGPLRAGPRRLIWKPLWSRGWFSFDLGNERPGCQSPLPTSAAGARLADPAAEALLPGN